MSVVSPPPATIAAGDTSTRMARVGFATSHATEEAVRAVRKAIRRITSYISTVTAGGSPSPPGVEHELRDVAHEGVRVFVFLDPTRRHYEDVPPAARRLDDRGVVIDDLSDPACLVIHGRSRRQSRG